MATVSSKNGECGYGETRSFRAWVEMNFVLAHQNYVQLDNKTRHTTPAVVKHRTLGGRDAIQMKFNSFHYGTYVYIAWLYRPSSIVNIGLYSQNCISADLHNGTLYVNLLSWDLQLTPQLNSIMTIHHDCLSKGCTILSSVISMNRK